ARGFSAATLPSRMPPRCRRSAGPAWFSSASWSRTSSAAARTCLRPGTRGTWTATRAGRAPARASPSLWAPPSRRSGPTPADRGGKPAWLRGVAGRRPTYGLLSMDGVAAVAPSPAQGGRVTRTVDDCRLLLGELAGPVDAESGRLTGARLGVAQEFFGDEVEPDVHPVVEQALAELERLGATLVPVSLPSLALTLPAGLTILVAEAASLHHRRLRDTPDGYVPETRRMLELGALQPAAWVDSAQRARTLICREVAGVFRNDRIDALVTPTLPRTSIAVEDMMIETDLPRYIPYTLPANLTGLPAAS